MSDDIEAGDVDWESRKKIFDKALQHRGSIYYTYQRNYFAAKCVGWMGWTLDGITALFGGVLIFLLRKATTNQSAIYLAIGILSTSLISSFYGPKLRSRDYYQAGQEHQELYDDFDHYIQFDIGNSTISNRELREKLTELNDRRHRLNQSTPQLGGIWYYTMKWVEKVTWVYAKVVPWQEPSSWERESYDEVVPSVVSLDND